MAVLWTLLRLIKVLIQIITLPFCKCLSPFLKPFRRHPPKPDYSCDIVLVTGAAQGIGKALALEVSLYLFIPHILYLSLLFVCLFVCLFVYLHSCNDNTPCPICLCQSSTCMFVCYSLIQVHCATYLYSHNQSCNLLN